jgi:hypothetical protein
VCDCDCVCIMLQILVAAVAAIGGDHGDDIMMM